MNYLLELKKVPIVIFFFSARIEPKTWYMLDKQNTLPLN